MPDALLDAARAADLIVIGAHRHRPVRSALSGWRPLRTAARSSLPVVVVPEDWTGADGPVVVGLDDDDSSSAAVEFAAKEALMTDGRLTVLHAWQMPSPTFDGSVALLASPIEEKAGHRRILDGAVTHLGSGYPALTVDANLVHDNPCSALLAAARRSSLLVIGTHHRGILAGAFLGSVGQDTLVESRIPVCVVPAFPAA
jgi:nucleotide-binding universal stress UspA family protein